MGIYTRGRNMFIRRIKHTDVLSSNIILHNLCILSNYFTFKGNSFHESMFKKKKFAVCIETVTLRRYLLEKRQHAVVHWLYVQKRSVSFGLVSGFN